MAKKKIPPKYKKASRRYYVPLLKSISRDVQGNTSQDIDENKLKKYEHQSVYTLRGLEGRRNSNTSRISFIPSIPYGETKFWMKVGENLPETYHIKILGGQISYNILNMAGPGVFIDVYQLYDQHVMVDLDILSKTAVKLNWDPNISMLREKFNIKRRLSKFVLNPGESIQINSVHRSKNIQIEQFVSRAFVPCFLAVFRGASSATEIHIALSNIIDYHIGDHEDDKTPSDGKLSQRDINRIMTEWDESEEL